MLRSLAILWVLLISIQSFYQGLIYTYYVLNKDYIIAQLCENKTKPALQCDGKCHLRKVLQVSKERKSDESKPFLPSLEEIKPPILFCKAITTFSLHLEAYNLLDFCENTPFEYLFNYHYIPVFAAFEPPKA